MSSASDSYRSVKDLVFRLIHSSQGRVDYQTITAEVKLHFPASKWKKSHWAYYRTRIKKGEYGDEFSPEERKNLFGTDSRRKPRVSEGKHTHAEYETKKFYHSIKELVLHLILQTRGKIGYDAVTAEVKSYFPDSKWKKTHWDWYRSQIRRGKFKDLFTEEDQKLLAAGTKGRRTPNPKVKTVGDSILKRVRKELDKAAKGDSTLRFKINRWVHGRLNGDEVKAKKPTKDALWESGEKSCQICGKDFKSLKGVEIHRMNEKLGYSETNCQLLCKPCHQKLA